MYNIEPLLMTVIGPTYIHTQIIDYHHPPIKRLGAFSHGSLSTPLNVAHTLSLLELGGW